jgi:hypothetical protein
VQPYPAAVEALKAEETLPAGFVCASTSISTMLLNKIIEPSKSETGWQKATAHFEVLGELSKGIETMSIIRTGGIRWVAKGDVVAEVRFIVKLFAPAA